MLDKLIRLFDGNYKRYKMCPECNKRVFDSKWNATCQPCWEGVPKPPTQETIDKAMAIWGNQGNVANFILKSGGSVDYVSSVCEKCAKQFRPWRKYNIIYVDDKWFTVCKSCMR